MGKGKDSEDAPAMAAGCCCCLGLVILITGIILVTTAPDQEIDMWYSVVLCPIANTTTSFISYPATTSCPTGLTLSNEQSQTFPVLKDKFTSGLKYQPVVFRSDGTTVNIKFDVRDGSKVIFDSTNVADAGDLKLTPTARRMLAEDEDEDAPVDNSVVLTAEEVNPSGRKLLKSGGGGRSYSSAPMRSRNGRGSRFGSSSQRSTPYGYSGRNSVNRGTVIFVHNRGPRSDYRGGHYSQGGRYHYPKDRSDCSSTQKGCVYETGSDLTRDEFQETQAFEASKPANNDDAYTLTVYKATTTSSGSTQMPAVYISFFTKEKPLRAKIGTIFLIVGPVTICCLTPMMLFAMNAKQESAEKKKREQWRNNQSNIGVAGAGAGAAGAGGGAMAMGSNNNRKWQDSYSTYSDSEFQGPPDGVASKTELPPWMGGAECKADLADGDRLSTDVDDLPGGNYASVNHLVLRENDIERIEGLMRFPNLVRLDLKNNDIASLYGLEQHPPSLRSIDLSDNNLTSIEELGRLVPVVELNVANNNLEGHLNFSSQSLMWVNASLNDINSLPPNFAPNLRYCDFRGCDLRDISALHMCPYLETAVLASNDLDNPQMVMRLAETCRNLVYLDLTDNEFDTQQLRMIRAAFTPHTNILPVV